MNKSVDLKRARELVEDLYDIKSKLPDKSNGFVTQMLERFEQYDERAFVSEAQMEWLEDLADKYL